MKKIMIAFSAIALAAIANAASVQWSSSAALKNPDGSDADGSGYITMYLFSIDATTYGALTAGGDSAVAAAVWGAYGTALATASDSYVDDGMGQISIIDPNTYGVGDTAYAAVLFTYDEGAGEGITHYIGNAASYTFAADISSEISELDTFIGGDAGSMATAAGWAATAPVPEPTSGLLLLLGMAGLALKRKRA